MYKNVLRAIEDIGIYPSISLILFFTFFVIMVFYLIKKGKHYWDDAANLPLEDEKINSNQSDQ